MGLIDDISRMKSEGKTEEEISDFLSTQNLPPETINDAISQANIKHAISNSEKTEDIKDQSSMDYLKETKTMAEDNSMDEMQPSILNQIPAQAVVEEYPQYDQQAQMQTQQSYDYEQQYPQYQSGVSADTISEIAEQVVSEKLHSIKSNVEKVIDFKTTLEAKMESLNERLTRIEKIIDRLQISILQKVGEYVTNVDDIKKELVETQKTFKSMAEKHHTHK